MRLYPPVWITHRQAIGDDEIGGFRIPAGRIIVVAPWVTQRRPDIWPNPEVFDPERFIPERAAERPRGAYFPFSLGPRQCIGMGFALTEAQLALMTTAQRFRLCAPPGNMVEPEPLLTLRPRGGLPMLVRHR
jgi:cytochrome P450